MSSTGSLELFLHKQIDIDEDAALAYLSDGRRLTSGNVRDLGSAQDGVRGIIFSNANVADNNKYIFVFNKYYIDYEVDHVLQLLRVEPQFQPFVEGE